MFNGLGISMTSLSRLTDAHSLYGEGAATGISPCGTISRRRPTGTRPFRPRPSPPCQAGMSGRLFKKAVGRRFFPRLFLRLA